VIAADHDRQLAIVHDTLDAPGESCAYFPHRFQRILAMRYGRAQRVSPASTKTARAQPRGQLGGTNYVSACLAAGIARATAGRNSDELERFQLMRQG
jgi:hypothetical protein